MAPTVTGEDLEGKSRTQRIMEAMPSSQQAMGAGGSSTYQVKRSLFLGSLWTPLAQTHRANRRWFSQSSFA